MTKVKLKVKTRLKTLNKDDERNPNQSLILCYKRDQKDSTFKSNNLNLNRNYCNDNKL